MDADVKEKLRTLLIEYTLALPNKIAAIEDDWQQLKKHYDHKAMQDFHRAVHSLCGSAGTYGYTLLGQSARQLEIYLKALLENTALSTQEIAEISRLLAELIKTFKEVIPEKLTEEIIQSGNALYLIDTDDELINENKNLIEEAGYQIYKMADTAKLLTLVKQHAPAGILINTDMINDQSSQDLAEFKKQFRVPLFCFSTKIDMLTRLKSIRIGGQVFLQKPIDSFYLTKVLDEYCKFSESEPYRILIVDDSQALAQYFALTLERAGMIADFITNPLLLLETIDEFQPDLLLMDLYMPECTGLELAAILRQEPQYTKIPIIFLSTEDNRLKQLSALNIGGDDFLTKPILPQHLVEAVRSRAKRAGILSSFMMRDSLTSLLNHTNILQRLELEVARALRHQELLSFMMIDIDHFKKINDHYGHPAGDKVIRSLANFLSSNLRKTDLVGRYGGEEFAIILPHTDKATGIKIGKELQKKFATLSHQFNQYQFKVTFSAGIASLPPLKDAKALLNGADQALYLAKHQGRNRVAYFDEEVML